MRLALLLFPLVLAGCASKQPASVVRSSAPTPSRHAVNQSIDSDPIKALVARLSATQGLWVNGIFPKIDLPSIASTQQVLERVFQMTGFDMGHVKTFRIIQTREVHVDGGFPDAPYTAVLVETDLGRKIVLLRPSSSPLGWWSRVYDAQPTA